MKGWISLALVVSAAALLGAPVATVPLLPTDVDGQGAEQSVEPATETVVQVALYDCGWNNRHFYHIFNYTWTSHNHTYRIQMTVVNADDVRGQGNVTFSRDTFDLLLIGASASSYLVDGVDAAWRNAVRSFVENGGGYVGICGGANAATQGFEHPRNLFHLRVNQGVLGLTNVYINDYFMGEWQYLIKFGFDAFSRDFDNQTYPYYVSVNTSVTHSESNPIFSTYQGRYRDITYAGGPGMYPADSVDQRLGPVIPLLLYNEELMHTKPLHYWRPTVSGWEIWKNVTTNLSGTYAGTASTFGQGRVVLYGPHPEHRVVVNGSVEEYLGHGIPNFAGPVKRYVFNYFGQRLSEDYNWWIVRRSVAWAGGIPEEHLPPVD